MSPAQFLTHSIPLVLVACNAVLGHDPGVPVDPMRGDAGTESGATAPDASPGDDATVVAPVDACTGDACASSPKPDGPTACPMTCTGGPCVPRLHAGDQSGASTIAVYQNNVYWTNNLGGTVMVAPSDGSVAAHAFATAQPHPAGIHVESGGVFWSSLGTGNFDGNVSRANFDGTNQEKLAEFGDAPYRLTGYAGYLYWSEVGATTSAIIRMESGGFNQRFVSKDLPKLPTSVSADASGVYWTTPAAGTITKAPIGCIYANDHGCARTVVMGRANPIALAVSKGDLFWAEDGGVFTSKADGTCPGAVCPLPLATNQVAPIGIVSIDDEIFWANAGTKGQNDGTIMFARRDGTCPLVLATGQASPSSIAVDDNRVYWLSFGSAPAFADGKAQSIPRPGH